jgi:hypothetical protein
MDSQHDSRKHKINAVFNLVASLLFLVAGFNLLGGGGRIDWPWIVVAVLFFAGGLWGLVR